MACATCKHWRDGFCHASEDMGEAGAVPVLVDVRDMNIECFDWEKDE